MRALFRPRPSSLISMLICPASCDAETRTVPAAGLPRRMRSSGGSMPWSAQLRTRWVRGSRINSISWRSSSVSPPSVTKSIFLFSPAARSRTMRGRFAKTRSTGCMRARITASCKSEVVAERRCNGDFMFSSSLCRVISSNWFRVSTSSDASSIIRSSAPSRMRIVSARFPLAASDAPDAATGACAVSLCPAAFSASHVEVSCDWSDFDDGIRRWQWRLRRGIFAKGDIGFESGDNVGIVGGHLRFPSLQARRESP